jgi:2-C-methyl-D-erythritol 2,4-cyclodiphosphate synthase
VRIGNGFDAHAFAAGVPMHLAGLHFPDETVGLQGHSDGDAAAHALCDALLSAAGLGDMGSNYGTSAPQWADASGLAFLAETRSRIEAAGYQCVNATVAIIGERPRLAARRAEAEQVLSDALGAPVSITATTTDSLGFTGQGQGLAAFATALIEATR